MKIRDIILKRDEDGKAIVNVEHLWIVHSPNGMDFGFGGYGAADLALNILISFDISRSRAWSLHQDFKWRFLAKLPREIGGVIRADDMLAWILDQEKDFSGPDCA